MGEFIIFATIFFSAMFLWQADFQRTEAKSKERDAIALERQAKELKQIANNISSQWKNLK